MALSVKIKTNSSPQCQVLARSVNVCIKCSKELKVLKSAHFGSTDPVRDWSLITGRGGGGYKTGGGAHEVLPL